MYSGCNVWSSIMTRQICDISGQKTVFLPGPIISYLYLVRTMLPSSYKQSFCLNLCSFLR